MSGNTWPGGTRHAMTQSEHEKWNASTFPGTLQLCSECDEPTGRCEDDSLFNDDGYGPYCPDCWDSMCRESARQEAICDNWSDKPDDPWYR